jgi:peptidyl-tRNA hydrolase
MTQMRSDCPDLGGGKAVAQGSHASNAMVFEGRNKASISLDQLIDEWQSQTAQGFGSCVTRICDNADMEQTVAFATLMGVHAGIVHDPTYPLRDGRKFHFLPVNTCAYVFGRKSVVDPLVMRFPWMPNSAF